MRREAESTVGASPNGVDQTAVRVLIVDDSPDIRAMLRLLLRRDGRFQVVGEGTNGREAAELCASLRPDLVVLDRQMPVMGGLEAIPGIRGSAPDTEIVLYTAAAEAETERAAIGAGAIGVLRKDGPALDLAQDLAGILATHWADPAAEVEIRVGPVPAEAARLWVANTQRILAALELHPDAVGRPVPEDVMAVFHRFLDAWEAVAASADVFLWVGRAGAREVREVVEEWVRVDSMDEDTLAGLGCSWSPPDARPFFDALTAAVVGALGKHADTRRLAERLVGGGWADASR